MAARKAGELHNKQVKDYIRDFIVQMTNSEKVCVLQVYYIYVSVHSELVNFITLQRTNATFIIFQQLILEKMIQFKKNSSLTPTPTAELTEKLKVCLWSSNLAYPTNMLWRVLRSFVRQISIWKRDIFAVTSYSVVLQMNR